MEIYIIEDYKNEYRQLKGSELTDRLILDCLLQYGLSGALIARNDKGKPYIKQLQGDKQIHISVSHSKDIFVCIISEFPVGIDIQHRKNASGEKIAGRYFSDGELAYIKSYGDDGFYRIWTRKEAYCKLTGNGLADIIRGCEVLDRNDVEFTDMQLMDGVFLCCARWIG